MITPKVPDHTWQNAMNVGNELGKEGVTECTVVSIADFFHVIMCVADTNMSFFYLLLYIDLFTTQAVVAD